MGRINARVKAGDHEQTQLGEYDRATVFAGGCESAIARQR
jgi:hypothetical protein